MKKLRLVSVSILFTALCLAFTACNQSLTAGQGTGTVRIVIDNGATRSVTAEGMPEFNGRNTKITVTGEDGTQLAEGKTSVTLQVPAGKKITITAIVTTAAGEWRGITEHTVTSGTNTIAVKLSKAPKNVRNILIDVDSTGRACTLKTESGKQLLSGIPIDTHDGVYPVIARDRIGRVYVLYKETFSIRHLKRFDVEGNEDTRFEGHISHALPSGISIGVIDNIAIDAKNNTIFLFYDDSSTSSTNMVCINETAPNDFKCSAPVQMNTLDASISSTSARRLSSAAYNGMLFFAVYNPGVPPTIYHLFACKAELSGTTLTLTKVGNAQSINQLRTAPAFNQYSTECKGLFADESGVYCLLAQKDDANHHAVGKIIRYEYSDSGLTQKAETGLNSNELKPGDFLTVDADSFSYPISFIGSDEENLYIADDGANIEYLNENWRVSGNKNRIAAFNRETGDLTFSDTDATWYAEFSKYKKPNTKVLLWKRDAHGINYWISETGKEKFSDVSEANKLFEASSSVKPTDVFCYDQDGNLYILWKDDSSSPNHNVRRFVLKDGVSYDSTGADLNNSLGTHPVSAIAVDISDGQNYLYYTYEDGPHKHIQRYSWAGTSFSTAANDSEYGVHINSQDISFTALAANKDGVFAAVKETYKEVVSGVNIDKYRLKVQKYAKTGTHTAPDSEITLVDNAVSYTDVSDPPNPIADPNPGNDPNAPCHQYQEAINALQIGNGRLYGISSKLHRKWIQYNGGYFADVFKNGSKLYEIGDTAKALPTAPLITQEKPVDDTNKVGYGFYRFIAVKYDEQERIKFIIASDSAWGDGVSAWNGDNSDRIVEFNLKGMVFGEEKESGGTFSKAFNESGFFWN